METMEVSPDLTFTARNLQLTDAGGNLVAKIPPCPYRWIL